MSIFWPNISQLKCSAGRRDVIEIKTKILSKIRDKPLLATLSQTVKTNTVRLQNNKEKSFSF